MKPSRIIISNIPHRHDWLLDPSQPLPLVCFPAMDVRGGRHRVAHQVSGRQEAAPAPAPAPTPAPAAAAPRQGKLDAAERPAERERWAASSGCSLGVMSSVLCRAV